jgi:hypothetical protein
MGGAQAHRLVVIAGLPQASWRSAGVAIPAVRGRC